MMVKVKICGITNAPDALWAARAGADALGFNFWPGSKRHVDPSVVRAIVAELPPFVSSVGVFVDASPEQIREIAGLCALDYVQLHGNEPPSICAKLKGLNVIKAFRIRAEGSLRELGHYDVRAYLLDTYVEGKQGGTGERFDWHLARGGSQYGKIILAGGLKPENVGTAILAARPYAVDVATGVEEEPGKKSKELVEAFIRIAKSVDV
jgi:phosphoribosylanthranilate isomerase